MRGFRSARSTYWLRNDQQKLSRYALRNHHWNSFQRWRVDSKALAASVDSDKVNKNGIGAELEIINETPSTGDGWNYQHGQPLLTQKY
jgi:hypothetical protein